jgi:micrococcal nuclease
VLNLNRVFQYTLLCISFLAAVSCRTGQYQQASQNIYVTKVIDGDTFWGNDAGPDEVRVRLLGIDAPESRKSQHKEVGYYGKESAEYLKALLSSKKVRLEYDVDKYDQYGRTLAYVYLEDGTFVNAELLKRGYARVMTFPPNVKYADEFIRLQRKARRSKVGMWARDIN